MLISSFTMQWALKSFKERGMQQYRRLLTVTMILGYRLHSYADHRFFATVGCQQQTNGISWRRPVLIRYFRIARGARFEAASLL